MLIWDNMLIDVLSNTLVKCSMKNAHIIIILGLYSILIIHGRDVDE